jgi:hypothetical protein
MNPNRSSPASGPCVVLSAVFIGAIALMVTCGSASAAVLYETADPFGGPFGLIGFDVSSTQSVAVRFIPDGDHRLDSISVWFMNNDFSGALHPQVTLSLREDDAGGGASVPADAALETWTLAVSAVGWQPVLEVVQSRRRPLLRSGAAYWIVAESEAPGGLDGVWNWAGTGVGFMSICNGDPCEWSSGQGAVAATVVEGTPAQSADLNGDGVVDGLDLALLLGGWGSCLTVDPCFADLNGDQVVNGLDLAMLLAAWSA